MTRPVPTLEVERGFLSTGARIVAGMDEVGRGAIAGPVTVGVVAIDAGVNEVPAGLADSKLLTPRRREAMVPVVVEWGLGWATGSASAEEIDRHGIMTALSLAASRALASLTVRPDVVILDGSTSFIVEEPGGPRVVTRTKADQTCASVAAASVIAKVERDGVMRALHLEHPQFAWDRNKGYGAAVHTEALRVHGASVFHRRSWNLGI